MKSMWCFNTWYSRLESVVKLFGMEDIVHHTFLDLLRQLNTSSKDDILKATRITILFEGFYQSINDASLKSKLNDIRLERWKNHYGTPTLTFLLTYTREIELTKKYFTNTNDNLFLEGAWEITENSRYIQDTQNQLYVDANSLTAVTMPIEQEVTGKFLKTHNPSGGFTTTPCDPVSQKFIEYAGEVVGNGGTVLEIGAAFGAATLQALTKGARVFCNDIDPNNLAVVQVRHKKLSSEKSISITGDDSRLVLIPGSFPEELEGLPESYFDAILICRVLHFFTGEQIEKSLQQVSKHLKPGGKLFVVCETPYLKNWIKFIPEYEKRVADGAKWPGELTNPAAFESSGRIASLPQFVHWISKEILERSLINAKLEVECSSYIDRRGQFPDDLILDGRESVGVIVTKPC